MSTVIEIGADGLPVTPDFVLATRGGHKFNVIENVQKAQANFQFNAAHEISFDVYKQLNGVECALWDEIKDFRLVYVPYFDIWYEITVSLDESTKTIKHVTGTHLCEAELGQLMLFDVEINTEGDIAREEYVRPTVFYDPTHPEASLLNRIIADKATHYSINHVDESLRNIERMFSFNGTSIYDAFMDIAEECNCVFIFGEHDDADEGKIHRTISAYDLEDHCAACGGHHTDDAVDGKCPDCGADLVVEDGYGENANIFVSAENLANSLKYTSNASSVKNCFRLVAGDDLMTATVRNLNPAGNQYLWYFTDACMEDMSDELKEKLTEYTTAYQTIQSSEPMTAVPASSVAAYNNLVDSYSWRYTDLPKYDDTDYIAGYNNLISLYYHAMTLYGRLKTTMGPEESGSSTETTVDEQIQILTAGFEENPTVGTDRLDTTSLSSANTAIVQYARVFVNTAMYRIQVKESTYDTSTHVWSGILTLSNYIDEEDEGDTGQLTMTFNDDAATFLKQSVEKLLKNQDEYAWGIIALFESEEADFKNYLHDYSLDYLNLLLSACDAVISILVEHGASDPSQTDIYTEIYKPYVDRKGWLQEEIQVRETEVYALQRPADDYPKDGLLDYISKQRGLLRSQLDLKDFLTIVDEETGEKDLSLWVEFSSFRREQEYSNGNYISDGLDDSQLIARAKDFFDTASDEIKKSAELQHKITGNLYNYLAIHEFEGLNEKLNLGNWIHLMIDDELYKLRIISIEIDYTSLSNVNITFSDVIRGGDTMSDVKSILSKSQSMATTYNYVSHQAKRGDEAQSYLETAGQIGLDAATMKIINDISNQNLKIDGSGILMRRKNAFDENYSPNQTRIASNGLYYTTDDWETTSAAIGEYKYTDPGDGQTKTGYGVIAQTIVGSLFIGEELQMYSKNGGVSIDQNGLTINTDAEESDIPVFRIQKRDSNGDVIKTYMYVDSDGDFRIDAQTLITTIDGSTIELENYPTYTALAEAGGATINAANIVGTFDASQIELDSVQLTGTPTAPTPTAGDSSTQIATTAFVQSALSENITAVTVSISASDWDNNVCTKSVSSLSADDNVVVTYAPSSRTAYKAAGIYCSAQSAGQLTFTCSTTPTSTVDVNIMIIS